MTSVRLYNYDSETSLTKNERLALNSLCNNKESSSRNLTKTTVFFFLTKDKYLEGIFKLLNKSPQKMKFSFKYFLSNCDQICSFLRNCSHILKKSLMGIFIFCVVIALSLKCFNLIMIKNSIMF